MKIPNFSSKDIDERKVKKGKRDAGVTDGKVIYNFIGNLTQKYPFSNKFFERCVRLIYNNSSLISVIEERIVNILSLIQSYGYTYEESIIILESNINLITIDPINLRKNLAIINQFGYDEEFLVNPSIIHFEPEVIYSLSEYLKELNAPVNEKNMVRLYYCLKDRGRKYIVSQYPLKPRNLGPLYFAYDKSMKSKQEVFEKKLNRSV